MALCDDLRGERTRLRSDLNEVDKAIAAATSASAKRLLELQQADLRSQLSHVDTLIQQNCTGGGGGGALSLTGLPAKTKPASGLKARTTQSIAYSQALLKSLGLPAKAPKKPKGN